MSNRHDNVFLAVPQERLRALPWALPWALPAKAAHFRVWLPRKRLVVTQSTCGSNTFGHRGGVMHHRARGRAHGRANFVVLHTVLIAKTPYQLCGYGLQPDFLGLFPSGNALLIQTARASEVRGADATNVTQAWLYRGEFMSWRRLVIDPSDLTKRKCLLQSIAACLVFRGKDTLDRPLASDLHAVCLGSSSWPAPLEIP